MPSYEEYDTEAAALARLAAINEQLDYDRTGDGLPSWRQVTTEWMAAPVERNGKWLVQAFTPPPAGLPTPVVPEELSEAAWDALSWSTEQRGRQMPSLDNYRRVFHCDFSDPGVVADDFSNPNGGALFYTPSHPAAPNAHWRSIRTHPELYEFLDGGGLRLHAKVNSPTNYHCGNICSLNRYGRGRAFGKGIYVAEFEASHHLASFCAPLWLREASFVRLRGSHRAIHDYEYDPLEFDGNNKAWHNKGIQHNAARRPFPGHASEDYTNHGELDGTLTVANGWHEDVDLFGTRHTVAGEINDDWVVAYLDDREVARFPSFPDLLTREFALLCSQQVKAARLVAGENFSLTIYNVSVYEQ